jgi:hypothetical protein
MVRHVSSIAATVGGVIRDAAGLVFSIRAESLDPAGTPHTADTT